MSADAAHRVILAVDRWSQKCCNLNRLCWEAVLHDKAQKVLGACKEAVALEKDNATFRDSRGVAKAMAGELDGMIDDFQAYVDWAPGTLPDKRIERRKSWTEKLEKSGNPCSPPNRGRLLDELRAD